MVYARLNLTRIVRVKIIHRICGMIRYDDQVSFCFWFFGDVKIQAPF